MEAGLEDFLEERPRGSGWKARVRVWEEARESDFQGPAGLVAALRSARRTESDNSFSR